MHASFVIFNWSVGRCYGRIVHSWGPSSFSYLMGPYFLLSRYKDNHMINQKCAWWAKGLMWFCRTLNLDWLMWRLMSFLQCCAPLPGSHWPLRHCLLHGPGKPLITWLSLALFFLPSFTQTTIFLLWKHFLDQLDIIIS